MSVGSIPDPIFVRGLSRSGGTLMCTLLDAHSDIAMSYELYPELLKTDPDADLDKLADKIAKAGKHVKKCAPTEHFGVFIVRCARGGLSTQDFATLLTQVVREGFHLSQPDGRMRLMELCGLEKMRRTGKRRWGMKCNNAFEDYLGLWPRACFLNMLRDGRDVLASQLNTGNFKNSPREVAEAWQSTHRRFEALVERGDARARMVRYERLTHDPEAELRDICATLGLPFDPAMLQHHRLDLTIFKVGHLSGPRINKSIDTTMIGRWKSDLTPDQLTEFLSVAETELQRHGYH